MPSLDDLPSELLVQCASLLGSEDVKNVALVSRRFPECFGPALFRRIYWDLEDGDNALDWTGLLEAPGYTRVIHGHEFLDMLERKPELILRIKALFINLEGEEGCGGWEDYFPIVIANIWEKFTNLKELHIHCTWGGFLLKLPSLPSLESVILDGQGRGQHDEHLTDMYLDNLMREGLTLPKLRRLEFLEDWRKSLFLRPPTLDQGDVDLEGCVFSKSLETLKFRNAFINAAALIIMLEQFTTLKSLSIEKYDPCSPGWERGPWEPTPDLQPYLSPKPHEHDTTCSLKPLSKALVASSATLEELKITLDTCAYLKGEQLLGSLRGFPKLTNLFIESELFIGQPTPPTAAPHYGRIICESNGEDLLPADRELLEASAKPQTLLASMLPNNLEYLTLRMGYGSQDATDVRMGAIIDALIPEKQARLLQLTEVTIIRRPLHHWYPEDNDKAHMRWSQEMVIVCNEVGIDLKLVLGKRWY